MAFTASQLPNEPIVIIKPALPFEQHVQTVHWYRERLAQLVEQVSSTLYCIVDARALDISFSDILLWLNDANGQPLSTADPRVKMILVGTHPLLGVCMKKAQQQLNLTFLWYGTLEDALAYAHAEVAAAK
jgi:hypothetical protein